MSSGDQEIIREDIKIERLLLALEDREFSRERYPEEFEIRKKITQDFWNLVYNGEPDKQNYDRTMNNFIKMNQVFLSCDSPECMK